MIDFAIVLFAWFTHNKINMIKSVAYIITYWLLMTDCLMFKQHFNVAESQLLSTYHIIFPKPVFVGKTPVLSKTLWNLKYNISPLKVKYLKTFINLILEWKRGKT